MTQPENSALLLQVKRSSFRTALTIVLAGLVITTAIALYINHSNNLSLATRFHDAARDRVERITEKLLIDIDELNDIRKFFEASDKITQSEFTKYTSSIIQNNHFWIISWADMLNQDELGNAAPKRFQKDSLVTSNEKKKSYFLIKTIEPYSQFLHFIDWDVSTDNFIKSSIDSSLSDQSLYISEPPSTHFSDTTANFRLILTPVFKNKSGRNELDGVLVAVYPIDSIVRALSIAEQPKGLSFTLFEGDTTGKMRKIYHLPPRVGAEEVVNDPDLLYTSYFSIAGKSFMVEVKPNDYFIRNNHVASLFGVLFSGYLLTFSLGFFIYRYLTGRRFKKLVAGIAEEARKKNFSIITEFLNSSVDMIGLKTTRGTPVSFNKVFAEFASGQKFDKLPAAGDLNIIPELNVHLSTLDDKILPDSEVVLYQFEFKDFVYDVRKFPVILDDDEYYIGFIIRDITTEINQLNEILGYSKKLEDNNRTKNKFFSIIAHDLRSPFQGILGFLEVILDEFEEIDDSEKKKLLTQIFASTQNIYDLLDNLLEWSRTQTDRIPCQPEKVVITDVLDVITGLYGTAAEKKKIKLENKITEPVSVFADRNMVRTIFRNLVSNAIKFTPAGGKITLDARFVPAAAHSLPHIVFSVSDTGVGIDAGTIDKIFRLDEKTVTRGTDNEKGTGLGLILCKEFVEKNGGEIWIESTPGKGSSFYFTLPVGECELVVS